MWGGDSGWAERFTWKPWGNENFGKSGDWLSAVRDIFGKSD